jgi:hypothetical protein
MALTAAGRVRKIDAVQFSCQQLSQVPRLIAPASSHLECADIEDGCLPAESPAVRKPTVNYMSGVVN